MTRRVLGSGRTQKQAGLAPSFVIKVRQGGLRFETWEGTLFKMSDDARMRGNRF